MTARSGADDRLDSWKDIASYLGRNVRTVIRWEKDRGLPIHRVPGGQRHAVYAWRHEIDDWLSRGRNEVLEIEEPLEPLPRDPSLLEPCTGIPAAVPSTDKTAHRKRSILRHWTVWATSGLLVLGSCGYAIRSLAFRPGLHFTGAIQLTDDGHPKEGLVSDGTILYFAEMLAGRTELAYVPIGGGTIHTIPTSFLKPIPIDISRARRELLLSVKEGTEEEGRLWVLPLAGGQPRPVRNIRCHAAAWSPDSNAIAFAYRSGIYLTTDEGASTMALQEFDRVPKLLSWSLDGRSLRFVLKAPDDYESSLWQMTLDHGSKYEVQSLEPLHVSVQDPGSLVLDRNGRSLITGPTIGGGDIFLIERKSGFWKKRLSVSRLERSISGPGNLFLDRASNRMFAIGNSAVARRDEPKSQMELLRLDLNTNQFGPFLPGVSAKEVDFSRDGKKMAFIGEPAHTLWISNADGSDTHEVPFSVTDMELPRWSPDGKSIAVMARIDGRPWRVFVISVATSRVTEASIGNDNQGAPTWSPDGRSIVYGNVRCQESLTCAIRMIDLATKKQTIIPGSEGLGTARWSPDGHFIAALAPEKHQVMIFDIEKGAWRRLLDDVNGDDLGWSRDSRFVYASRTTNHVSEILRVPPAGGTPERAVDLTGLTKLNGQAELWFAPAPDGTFVVAHYMTANEIFALPYKEED